MCTAHTFTKRSAVSTLRFCRTLKSIQMVHLEHLKRLEIAQAYSRHKSLHYVARKCGVHRNTVRRWVNAYHDKKSVEPVRGGGRKLELGPSQLSRVVSHLQHPGATTFSAAQDLFEVGLTPRVMHRSSISNLLRRGRKANQTDLHYSTRKPRKDLSQENKKTRLDFALANQGRDWSHVLFTDRKRFSLKNPGAVVHRGRWLRKGQKCVAHTVNHAATYNVYCGMCIFGTAKPILVAGTTGHHNIYKTKHGTIGKNITVDEYNHKVLPSLLSDAANLFFKHGVRHWIFQQDNDNAHEEAEDVIRERRLPALLLSNWPPNSPDLNPIENLWSWVDEKVQALGCKDFKVYMEKVNEVLDSIPEKVLRSLVSSMTHRMEEVIALEGDRTSH